MGNSNDSNYSYTLFGDSSPGLKNTQLEYESLKSKHQMISKVKKDNIKIFELFAA